MENARAVLLLAFVGQFLAGCTTSATDSSRGVVDSSMGSVVGGSYLAGKSSSQTSPQRGTSAEELQEGGSGAPDSAVRKLQSLSWTKQSSGLSQPPNQLFKDSDQIIVAADNMPAYDFLHYVFGDLLRVNYVIDPSIVAASASAEAGVTLNLTSVISSRRLFDLTSELMGNQGIHARYDSGTFFLHRSQGSDAESRMVIGIGGDESSVPRTTQKILQVVPLKFGIKVSVERTLRTLTKAKITPDFEQSSMFVEGTRDQVIQVLSLIKLLDTPAMRGRNIGIIELDFLRPTKFAIKVKELLGNEGIDLGLGGAKSNVVLVPLPSIGAVAIFATDLFLLNRVSYWAEVLDVPGDGPSYQYFVYNPMFSRAKDLGTSISALLDLSAPSGSGSFESGPATGNAPSSKRSIGADGGDVKLVVDEKANALVFYAVGSAYRSLLPLIRKLDIMPKQVMLDIVIAEVSLQDEFKHGVEWALSRGEVKITTQGAFGATGIGGFGVIINGSEGPVNASFLSTNNLVKVLSNPTLMVRDGSKASISVGSSISVTGQTTQDPINGQRQTSSAEYRKTGVKVTVEPTVNAQGIVAMEINQSISNTVPGSSGSGGNPDIFERSLITEVLANSGQMVMLAGLISDNSTQGGSGTPGFENIPLIGNLFKSKANTRARTELIMLITPKVMADLSEWGPLVDDFKRGLKYLNIQNTAE